MKQWKVLTLLGALVVFLASACVDQKAVDEIKTGINDIKAKQGEIQDKLAKMEKSQTEMAAKVEKAAAAAPAQRPPQPEEPTGPVEVTTKDASIKGDPKAPVSIVEWSDFQCPFCSKIVPIVEETMKDPEVAGKVNFVFKQFPLSFHQQADPAARASLAAGKQGKFFEMHDKLFAGQRELADGIYEKWAGEIGLDVEKFKKDMADPAIAEQVKAEMAEGQKVGVRGTPTLFIGINKGDKFIVKKANGRSVDFYKQMIKDALAEAAKG